MDALNPKTSGGTHLPGKGPANADANHGQNIHDSNTVGTGVSTSADKFGDRSHGQQTGNTIHGASTTGSNQTGFTECMSPSSVFSRSRRRR